MLEFGLFGLCLPSYQFRYNFTHFLSEVVIDERSRDPDLGHSQHQTDELGAIGEHKGDDVTSKGTD